MKIFVLTTCALIAFAFNSILCRLALGSGSIDAAGFTSIRMTSGMLVLLAVVSFSTPRRKKLEFYPGNWLSGFFLFAYAICFSFAYNGLTTATGALILFGSVQLTMFTGTIVNGVRPGILEWIGLAAAFSGLVYLVLPGLEAPPLVSSFLMAAAGSAWGFYSLRGRGSEDPVTETFGNFYRSLFFLSVVAGLYLSQAKFTWFGFWLAAISGAIASGLGYAVWYAALKYHSSARAAILQLSVPLIAAAGGVVIVAEPISSRLPVAALLILGGILATVVTRKQGVVVTTREC